MVFIFSPCASNSPMNVSVHSIPFHSLPLASLLHPPMEEGLLTLLGSHVLAALPVPFRIAGRRFYVKAHVAQDEGYAIVVTNLERIWWRRCRGQDALRSECETFNPALDAGPAILTELVSLLATQRPDADYNVDVMDEMLRLHVSTHVASIRFRWSFDCQPLDVTTPARSLRDLFVLPLLSVCEGLNDQISELCARLSMANPNFDEREFQKRSKCRVIHSHVTAFPSFRGIMGDTYTRVLEETCTRIHQEEEEREKEQEEEGRHHQEPSPPSRSYRREPSTALSRSSSQASRPSSHDTEHHSYEETEEELRIARELEEKKRRQTEKEAKKKKRVKLV